MLPMEKREGGKLGSEQIAEDIAKASSPRRTAPEHASDQKKADSENKQRRLRRRQQPKRMKAGANCGVPGIVVTHNWFIATEH